VFSRLSAKSEIYTRIRALPLIQQTKAMATAAASIPTDLTNCSICLDLFDDPKSLPCLHAFCLKCLQVYFKYKSPGNKADCPVCRKEFHIPRDGVGGLPHHFIVQQLVEQVHLRESACDKHADKQVELYCHDCDKNVCALCSADEHSDHNCGKISEVAENFRARIDQDDREILCSIDDVEDQLDLKKEDKTKFLSKLEDVKKRVVAVGDIVKRSVDDQVSEVLTKLQSVESESTSEADDVQETYEVGLESMESFHNRSRKLLDKGRSHDITRAACELHKSARYFLDSDIIAYKYCPPQVTFTPADVTQAKRLDLIGKLTVTYAGMLCLQHSCYLSFLPRDAMHGADHAYAWRRPCLCMAQTMLTLSVCPSHGGIVLRQLNVS